MNREPLPDSAPDAPAALVEELLASCLEVPGNARLERLAEACTRHPELAAELRARLAWLEENGLADDTLAAPPASPTAADSFAGYRLLRRLGGGGMGVVHLAEEAALGRQVALKTVRPEQLWFAGARERFLREVKTIAQLQHAAIVPVYAVGEHDGVPWFTMERVQGATLAELLHDVQKLDGHEAPPPALDELHGRDAATIVRRRAGLDELARAATLPPLFAGSFLDFALRVIEQVADALAHAHAAGVLHRDVKPSNVMVAADGRVLLLDFGLASAGHAGNADAITRSGSPLGSLPYMSPEQVRGEPLDARSDVYSLGASFYELLTLRAAFPAGDPATTWRRVLLGDAPPPRLLQPGLPRDVDDVCRIAMDLDRRKRFATMAAFRDDLTRLREKRPIVARPPGPLLRARRFAQRHPTGVASVALALLAAAGVPSGFLLRERSARRAIEQSSRAAEESASLLEGLLLGAGNIGGRGPDTPIGELLADGAQALEQRLRDRPDLRGRLLGVLGRVHAMLGDDARALPLLQEAVSLTPGDPTDPEDTKHLLRIVFAEVLSRTESLDEAETALTRFLDDRSVAIGVGWRAQALAQRASVRMRLDRTEPAERDLDEAIALLESSAPLAVSPNVCWSVYGIRGKSLMKRGLEEAALPWLQRSHATMVAANGIDHPRVATTAAVLAACELRLGRLDDAERDAALASAAADANFPLRSLPRVEPLRVGAAIAERRGDFAAAERSLLEALAIVEAKLPVTAWPRCLVSSDFGHYLLVVGRFDEAATQLRAAARQALESRDAIANEVVVILIHAADALAANGELADAQRFAGDAITRADALPPDFVTERAGARRAAGWIALASGRLDDADALLRDALGRLERSPTTATRAELAACQSHLALLHGKRGRPLEAEASARAALATLEGESGAMPWLKANATYLLGWSLELQGRHAEAETELLDSIAQYDRSGLGDHPLAAFPHEQLGMLRLQAKRQDEALPCFERALAIRVAKLRDGDPWLNMTRNNCASARQRAGRIDEAMALHEANAATARALGLDGDEALAASLFQLARLRQARGELDLAGEIADEALRRMRVVYRAGHPTLQAALRLRADLYAAVDEPSLAQQLRDEADRATKR